MKRAPGSEVGFEYRLSEDQRQEPQIGSEKLARPNPYLVALGYGLLVLALGGFLGAILWLAYAGAAILLGLNP